MKCKYCLQTNVVKIGKLSYDQYYKCRSCNKHFAYTGLDQVDPQEIQHLLSGGIHRYAIARQYGCTHNAINRYIKKHNLIEPTIERVTFKRLVWFKKQFLSVTHNYYTVLAMPLR